ncbi:MAG: LacI family transcriptional regulator [Anaerolineae bacterium]|nr:LacI family transcriptional regulator [Anaerolineae bacterium]
MVLVSVSDPFTGRIVEGVEQAAIDAGFNVLISTSQNDFKRELAVMEAFQQRRVDGIIVMASHLLVQQRAFFDRIRVPVVMINEQEPTSDMRVVAVDDVRATGLAMEHLLALGHRRIGYVGTSNRPKSNQHRLKGYQKALKAAEVKLDEALTFLGDDIEDHAQRGAASLDALLAAKATAVFCYNDVTAIGLLAECRKRGVRVPQDLSVVGFDDIDMAAYAAPPLTTIRQPRFEYGQRAMKMLLAVLNGEQPKNQILLGQLVVRETTARLGSAR